MSSREAPGVPRASQSGANRGSFLLTRNPRITVPRSRAPKASEPRQEKHGSLEHEAHEVAQLTISIVSPEAPDASPEARLGGALGEQSADDFFRAKGPAAPALAFLSLLDSAVTSLRPVEEGHSRLQDIEARAPYIPEEEDWSFLQKYDAFYEILQSTPQLEVPRYEPIQSLLKASSSSGTGKYDLLRALMEGMTNADESQEISKWDLVGEILHKGKAKAALQALETGDLSQIRKYDMVWDLFSFLSMSADWGLPNSGIAHDVLHFDDWGSREADPVGWLLDHAWHENVKPRWDPLAAAFRLAPTTLRAKWDPLTALLSAEAPSSKGILDPIGTLLAAAKSGTPQPSKYDPVPGLLSLQAHEKGENDPLGSFIRSLTQADFSNVPDAFSDMMSGISRFAEFGGQDLTGLSSKSRYFPNILAQFTPPSAPDPLMTFVRSLKPVHALGKGRSKYDPIPDALSASSRPLDPKADPLIALLKSPPPTSETGYDPVRDILEAIRPEAAGIPRSDLLGALSQISAPDGQSKYDPLPGVLAANGRPVRGERLDLFRGFIKGLLKPRQASKSREAVQAITQDLQNLLDPRDAGMDPSPAAVEPTQSQQTPSPVQKLVPDAEAVAMDILEPEVVSQRQGRGDQDRGSHPPEPHSMGRSSVETQESSSPATSAAQTQEVAGLASKTEDSNPKPPSGPIKNPWDTPSQSSGTGAEHAPANAKPPTSAAQSEQTQSSLDSPTSASDTQRQPQQPLQQPTSRLPGASSSRASHSSVTGVSQVESVVSDPSDSRLTLDERAQLISRQPPFKRPFAAVDGRNTWPQDGENQGNARPRYQQRADSRPSRQEAVGGEGEAGTQLPPYVPKIKGSWNADVRADSASSLPLSKRPFAASGEAEGWLEAASTPLGAIPLPAISTSPKTEGEQPDKARTSSMKTEPAQAPPRKPLSAAASPTKSSSHSTGSQAPPPSQDSGARKALKDTWSASARADALSSLKPSQRPFAAGEGSGSWLEAASRRLPSDAPAEAFSHPQPQTQQVQDPSASSLGVQQSENLADVLQHNKAPALPRSKSLSAQLQEHRDAGGAVGAQKSSGPKGLERRRTNLDNLRDQWKYLQQQSDNLRKKFPVEERSKAAVPVKPAEASVKRSEDSEEDRLRNADALRRQLAQVQQQRALTEYDLVPDILRLRGAMRATPMPVAGYDPMAVLAKRAGSTDVTAVTRAFKQLAADKKLASKHAPLYRIMQASLPSPNPRQGRLPPPPLATPGLAISAAEKDTGALLQDIGNSREYNTLHQLLRGRRPETVVGAICALAALLQPAIASS